jgi:hypothetical protein
VPIGQFGQLHHLGAAERFALAGQGAVVPVGAFALDGLDQGGVAAVEVVVGRSGTWLLISWVCMASPKTRTAVLMGQLRPLFCAL